MHGYDRHLDSCQFSFYSRFSWHLFLELSRSLFAGNMHFQPPTTYVLHAAHLLIKQEQQSNKAAVILKLFFPGGLYGVLDYLAYQTGFYSSRRQDEVFRKLDLYIIRVSKMK